MEHVWRNVYIFISAILEPLRRRRLPHVSNPRRERTPRSTDPSAGSGIARVGRNLPEEPLRRKVISKETRAVTPEELTRSIRAAALDRVISRGQPKH